MLFGGIRRTKIFPGAIGAIVEAAWRELPHGLPSVAIDAFAIMPDHLHGIVVLRKKKRAETSSAPTADNPSLTLARVVHAFKSTARMQVGRQTGRHPGRASGRFRLAHEVDCFRMAGSPVV